MLYIFVLSAMLLVGVYGMARFEMKRTMRLGGNARRLMERRTARFLTRTVQHKNSVLLFVRRDIWARSLHVLTYLALLLVRFVERKLASFAQHLRRMRKPVTREPYVSRLRMVSHERRMRTEFDDDEEVR